MYGHAGMCQTQLDTHARCQIAAEDTWQHNVRTVAAVCNTVGTQVLRAKAVCNFVRT